MSLWCNDQDPLARQRDQGFSRGFCDNQAGEMRLRLPNDINRGWVLCTNEGKTHQKVPKKLAKAKLPKCAGCLFGAMTKIPWRGRETKASHEVFVTTKPGQCISVDQMTSTEVGFYAQMKGKLTKKRYRCATILVDHLTSTKNGSIKFKF